MVRDLVHAAMRHVPARGWTTSAIAAGAADVDLPPSAVGLLWGGVDKLHAAVMARLALLAPVKSLWPEALALCGRPDAVGGALRATSEFVDEAWAYAGDVSTDSSWYIKHAGLATAYHTIGLYLLTDAPALSVSSTLCCVFASFLFT
ncbi:hypothetical protein I4F81_009175 [Pyropia yezoensis]|uniref:Uncharacterized protein n=1 Tax=Pyropia yezoensis TaxID=2788 RepID=A0ACC3C8Q3_PYRYE|nr:hypothetical protein I4F81_009175 [Neopyropia yezoensis]